MGRYHTLTDLLDKSEANGEVAVAKSAISPTPIDKKDFRSPECGWALGEREGHPYVVAKKEYSGFTECLAILG